MPTAALRYCLHPQCPEKVTSGRCLDHQQGQERQRGNLDVRRWYRTARWFALRRQVLSDNPLCVQCQHENHVALATEVDHIVPHKGEAATFWARANLQGLCASHHSAKTRRGE